MPVCLSPLAFYYARHALTRHGRAVHTDCVSTGAVHRDTRLALTQAHESYAIFCSQFRDCLV